MRTILILVTLVLLTACDAQPSVETRMIEVTVEVPVREQVTVMAEREAVVTVQVPVEVTREVFIDLTEPTPAPVGSSENPLQLLTAPVGNPESGALRMGALADALAEATGLVFEPVVAADYATLIEQACARTGVALMPNLAYIAANAACGMQATHAGIRFDWPYEAAMIVIRAESDIDSLAALDGLRWGTAAQGDFLRGLQVQALLETAGVQSIQVSEYDTDAAALEAIYTGEVDFVSADFKPPILPFDERAWLYGQDDPEIWLQAGLPQRSGIGFAVVLGYVEDGGYQVRDARAATLDSLPLIFARTRILQVTTPFPNDAIAFSADMPLGVAAILAAALETHASEGACAATMCAPDLYNWEGVIPLRDADYDPLRDTMAVLEWDVPEIARYLDARLSE